MGRSAWRPAGAPRHGPVAPRPACCGRPRAESVLVGVGAAASVGRSVPSPRPPPPLQVPSASRRGGLKTHGGSRVRLGVGAVGPVGSREDPPFSPRLRFPRPPLRGRGAARHWSSPPRPSGGGYPAAVVRAGAVGRARARPASLGGGRG